MEDLFEAMAKIAEPVMERFQDDFRLHDRKVVDGLKAGDVVLWSPRTCGTNLIVLSREFRPNVRAKEHYDAVQSLEKPDWHSIQIGPRGWVLEREPEHADLVARWAQRAAAGGETISELHL